MPFGLRIFFTITSVMWLLSYQVGAYFNGKYLPLRRRMSFHFLALLSAVLVGMLECLTPVISLLSKPKTFEVISK